MVSHVTQVSEGVHRLTNGVANFYLIQESGKLVLGMRVRQRTGAIHPGSPPAAKIYPVQQRRG